MQSSMQSRAGSVLFSHASMAGSLIMISLASHSEVRRTMGSCSCEELISHIHTNNPSQAHADCEDCC